MKVEQHGSGKSEMSCGLLPSGQKFKVRQDKQVTLDAMCNASHVFCSLS